MVEIAARTCAWTTALVLMAMTAYTTPQSNTGRDPGSRDDASLITWNDGQPAYAITCEAPDGCQTRAVAVCRNGSMITLKSDNMPTIDARREALGPPSIVVRCGS
jgi:hypothetical protein